MAATTKPWDGSASRFQDDEWRRSCILDRGDCSAAGKELTPKERYSLPIREPNGSLNANALGSASAALAGARTPIQACPAAKTAAAKRLLRAYSEANVTPPDSLKQRAA